MSEVSTISSASSRIVVSRARSSRMPSLTERSGASGCGRRVSLNRRTSASWLASRKISIGLSPGIALQLAEDLRKRREEPALADVDDDRDLRRSPPARRDSFASVGIERRRQVVDAEVAEVLERANRLRLAGARQPGEHDEPAARPLCGAARRVRGAGSLRLLRAAPARATPAPRRAVSVLARVIALRLAAADCAPRLPPAWRCCVPGATGIRMSGTCSPRRS